MKFVQSVVFVLAGCAMTPVGSVVSSVEASEFGLPPVRGALEFAPGTREISMQELVQRLSELTGCELATNAQTTAQLMVAKELLENTEPVPADEVYAFVETLLARQDFFLAPAKAGTRPVVTLVAGNGQPQGSWTPVTVGAGDRERMLRHPALLVRTAMSFRNIDTRQLQTQLRQLLVDPTGMRQVVPAGERNLIVQGPAADVASLLELLRLVDENSASSAPATPAPAETPR